MIFLDTNIILYAVALRADEQAKRTKAIDLIQQGDCAASVQVLNEFVVQATKSGRRGALSFDEAMAVVKTLRRFPIRPLDLPLFDAAQDVRARTQYSWWDALIVAAAISLGCDTLATEDMQHGRVIDGVRIVNPFRDVG